MHGWLAGLGWSAELGQHGRHGRQRAAHGREPARSGLVHAGKCEGSRTRTLCLECFQWEWVARPGPCRTPISERSPVRTPGGCAPRFKLVVACRLSFKESSHPTSTFASTISCFEPMQKYLSPLFLFIFYVVGSKIMDIQVSMRLYMYIHTYIYIYAWAFACE